MRANDVHLRINWIPSIEEVHPEPPSNTIIKPPSPILELPKLFNGTLAV